MDSQDNLITCKICNNLYIKKTLHNCPPKRSSDKFFTCPNCGKPNVNKRFHKCDSPLELYIDDALEGDAEINLFIIRHLRQIGHARSRILHEARSNELLVSLSEEFFTFPSNITQLNVHNQATYVEALYHTNQSFRSHLESKLISYINLSLQ